VAFAEADQENNLEIELSEGKMQHLSSQKEKLAALLPKQQGNFFSSPHCCKQQEC
jgi:hypothetical protein